jgi:hypothetical protein
VIVEFCLPVHLIGAAGVGSQGMGEQSVRLLSSQSGSSQPQVGISVYRVGR